MFYLDSDGVFARWRKYVLSTHFPGMTIKEFNALPESVAVVWFVRCIRTILTCFTNSNQLRV